MIPNNPHIPIIRQNTNKPPQYNNNSIVNGVTTPQAYNRFELQREETFEERLERIKRTKLGLGRPPSGELR